MGNPLEQARLQDSWREARQEVRNAAAEADQEREDTESPDREDPGSVGLDIAKQALKSAQSEEERRRRAMFGRPPSPEEPI